MKSHTFLRSALLSAGILSLGAASVLAQAAAGGGAAGARGGGGNNGTAGIARPMPAGGLPDEAQQPPTLNDLEITEITRIKLSVLSGATKAVTDARLELTKATFTNPASIAAKSAALAAAEQALATSRADAYATVLKGYKDATPEKKRAIAQSLGGAASGGRGGG
jgi:hypothetical protein